MIVLKPIKQRRKRVTMTPEERRAKNIEYIRKYNEEHREELRAAAKEYHRKKKDLKQADKN